MPKAGVAKEQEEIFRELHKNKLDELYKEFMVSQFLSVG
jgi:hypothetical protein